MDQKPDLLRFENEVWQAGFFLCAGVDEAGRGPLAGNVVAAAYQFSADSLRGGIPSELEGLTDSKALTAKKRDHFFELLQQFKGAKFGVGRCTPQEVDRFNVLNATHLAMRRAVEQIDPLPQMALVDGNPIKGLPIPHQNIIKGDAKSLSIAAASVLAKVTRDLEMVELDAQFPEYGFAKHKGYGTKVHLAAIEEYGPCSAHRMTFRPLSERSQLNFDF